MKIELINGTKVVTLSYADITSEGQQSVDEGYTPVLSQLDLKDPDLINEADIVVFHNRGFSTIIKSLFSERETDQILGIC